MKSKYTHGLAFLMMAGLFACDDNADAKGPKEPATTKSEGAAAPSAASKPTQPAKTTGATCAAVIDKMVSLAPKEDAASAREIWNGMCEELTEEQRKCIMSAKGTREIDKCVD